MAESSVLPTQALRQVTENLLDKMQKRGWWSGPKDARVRRFDRPTEWDINCGWCEEWAEEAYKRVGGMVVWFDDEDDPNHCVLYLDGLYYDAQHPEGVDDVELMDIFLGVTRDEFLAKKKA